MLWTEKYRPKRLKDVIGQEEPIKRILNFIVDYHRLHHKGKKAIMIHGPTGIGKTAAVYALANEMNYDIIEMNASDFRDKLQISRIMGSALGQKSLFTEKKLVLIDELEGFSGFEDKGGIKEIERLIDDSNYPIIIISSKPYDHKMSSLRRKTDMIEFKKIDYFTMTRILQKVSNEENLKIDYNSLKQIALKAKGDARAAINDLSTIGIGQKFITENEIKFLSSRDKEETIFNAMRKIFKGNANDALSALNNVDADLNECILWIDENIPLEYSGEDLAKAYDKLSKADVFRGRIIKRQHWRFLVYVEALATAGVAASKSKTNAEFIPYRRVSRILKMWLAKQSQLAKREIARKVARFTHTSKRRALQEMPLFEIIYQKSSNPEGINHELKLEENEIEYLQGRIFSGASGTQ